MKIYIILGHPNKDSFNGSIFEAYKNSALNNGHEVRTQELGEIKFDPILWQGYKENQSLEPDLLIAQENIKWCDKLVIVYPIWWGSMPALLKGFFDRTLLPSFAFKYHTKGPYWDKFLKGRSADIITTSDAPNFYIWLMYRNSDLNSVKRATLKFCGIKPIRVKRFGSIKNKSNEQLARIIKEVQNFVPKI
jgi:putative NADPH-quinone reductase